MNIIHELVTNLFMEKKRVLYECRGGGAKTERKRERKKGRRDRRSFRLLFIHEIFFYYYLSFTSMSYVKLLVSPCIFRFILVKIRAVKKMGRK